MIEYIIIALEVFRNNKVRSILTTLGIIIGVSSVVTIVSLGEGMTKTVEAQFEPTIAMIDYDWPKLGSYLDYTLTKDVNMLKEVFDDRVEGASKVLKEGERYITNRTGNGASAYLRYATKDTLITENEKLIRGRDFNDYDRYLVKRVVIIPSSIAIELFGIDDVLGENIFFGRESYTIIGVLKDKFDPLRILGIQGSLPLFYITDAVMNEKIGPTHGSDQPIKVKIKESEDLDMVMTDMVDFLKQIKNSEAYIYSSVIMDMEASNETLRLIMMTVTSIAGISLLVGCIGIINIMLVSVTERTREIGIRKAIGAKDKHIMFQFIIEAVIVSLIGGVIGIALGIIGSYTLLNYMGMLGTISLEAIIISTISSILVGLISGIYPARKAAKLDPIVALGHEL